MRTDPPLDLAPDLAPDLAGRRVLVGISGSIAAVKMPLVVSALVQQGAEVRCVLTASAAALVSPVALASLSRHRCYLDADQWSHQAARPLHVELAEWAELVLLAPLSATSLGRWVHGLADTLLASTLLATEAPVVAAAAMNTSMWEAGPVQRNWHQLQSFPRVLPLAPAPGLLACDRQGSGRMVEPELLLLALQSMALWGWQRDWQGLTLLVSAGPTREALDPARFLSNGSTGLMGVLLAQAARLRGASVHVVHGPLQLHPALLEGLVCTPVQTAAEMGDALAAAQPQANVLAMAAAVADHRRAKPWPTKLIKAALGEALADGWEQVPDLLAGLVAQRPAGQCILGFAAQSGDGLAEARQKLARKGCDWLFANPIDQPQAGFGSDTNQGWLLGPGGTEMRLASASKLAIAHQLLSAIRPPGGGRSDRNPAAADP